MSEDQECEVTVVDASGKRWTMTVRASTVNEAVIAYKAEQVCGNSRHFPKVTPGTEVEVQVRDGRVFRTTGARVEEWANEASRRDMERLKKEFAETEMTHEEHRALHRILHEGFDELLADYLLHNRGKLPSTTTCMELMTWSHQQTIEPEEDRQNLTV
jgi:hypothetical protein